MSEYKKSTGAFESPRDLRTFGYQVDFSTAPVEVGERWDKKHIRDQHRVGICTSIAVTQQATRHFGIEMSPEFQYLIQSEVYDSTWSGKNGWEEGSNSLHALKTGNNFGFLPKKEMDKWVDEDDRKMSYQSYVRKLKAIPEEELERMKGIAKQYKLAGYYKVPLDWNAVKHAIEESPYGVIVRFALGTEWYYKNGKYTHDKEDLEPLQPPTDKTFQSGHIVTMSNADGESWRIANSWGEEWCDEGTAYSLWTTYRPTEVWLPVFPETPQEDDVLEERRRLEKTLHGLLLRYAELLRRRIQQLMTG